MPWRPRANAPVDVLTVVAGTVYAGGEFTSISDTPRNYLAAIDGRSGALTDWNPAVDSPVSQLVATSSGLIAIGAFESIGAGTSEALAFYRATP